MDIVFILTAIKELAIITAISIFAFSFIKPLKNLLEKFSDLDTINLTVGDFSVKTKRKDVVSDLYEKYKCDARMENRKERHVNILWVDDHPENNRDFAESLRENNYTVDCATTTENGLTLFRNGNYDLVITDMGRKEDSRYVEDAGLILANKIREANAIVAIVIYTSREQEDKHRTKLKTKGIQITSSNNELKEIIEKM